MLQIGALSPIDSQGTLSSHLPQQELAGAAAGGLAPGASGGGVEGGQRLALAVRVLRGREATKLHSSDGFSGSPLPAL